jgi:hypothetical protein
LPRNLRGGFRNCLLALALHAPTLAPSRFEPFSDTTYRIQQQVPGIEQGTRFRKQELSISKQRGEHYL